MRRRDLILSLLGTAIIAATDAAIGKDAARTARIGLLSPGSMPLDRNPFRVFREALAEQGFVEGRNLLIEYRWAEGKPERLRELAAELAVAGLDVIFAPPAPAALEMRATGTATPIVFALSADPVGNGLVKSMARPGGNITGLSTMGAELAEKRLALLKEAFPRIARVAVIYLPSDKDNQRQLSATQSAARRVGVVAVPFALLRREDVGSVIATLGREQVDAVSVQLNVVTNSGMTDLVSRVGQSKLPAIYPLLEFVDQGGLLAYAVNMDSQFRRAAMYVAKILRGAKPADLPIEQPTQFDLAINMRTAKSLGVNLPQSVLLQATRIVE